MSSRTLGIADRRVLRATRYAHVFSARSAGPFLTLHAGSAFAQIGFQEVTASAGIDHVGESFGVFGGAYYFSCRLVNPVTKEELDFDENAFELMP